MSNRPALDHAQVERYLTRLGLDDRPAADLAGLTTLQRRHLTAVPFENLDLVFAGGVPHDRLAAVGKIVGDGTSRRGGWCFENNGAFGLLLESLGYEVRLLGAAVLQDGPSTTLEHLALEVSADGLEPHLVDVGFGQGPDLPLPLNRAGRLPGGGADFEFLPSPQGTTLAEYVDGVAAAQYRFKRVAHRFDDFAAVAHRLQTDPSRSWSSKPFATRRLDGGPDRVVLTHDALKVRRDGAWTVTAVDDWDAALLDWFGIDRATIGDP